MATENRTRYTHEEWKAEGRRRFGDDTLDWAFVCPVCKHVATVKDWQDAGAPESTIAFSCVGRWADGPETVRDAFESSGTGPCNYAGGGLFRLNPVVVTFPDDVERQTFDFAEYEECRPCSESAEHSVKHLPPMCGEAGT